MEGGAGREGEKGGNGAWERPFFLCFLTAPCRVFLFVCAAHTTTAGKKNTKDNDDDLHINQPARKGETEHGGGC